MATVTHHLSKEAHNILNAQEIRAKFPFLIKIEDVTTNTFEYYVNSDEAITYNGNTYQPAIFKITPPEITATKIGNATITMSNVTQEWIARIRGTSKRAKIQFIAVMIYDSNGTQQIESMFNNEFVLTDVAWDELSITWTMVFDDKWDIKIPSHICDTVTCAGIA